MKKLTITITIIMIFLILSSSSVAAHANTDELDFYEMIEEHSTVILLVDLRTGKIDYANKAASDFYGYTIDEIESMSVYEIATQSLDDMKKHMQQMSSRTNSYRISEHRLANGDTRKVEVYSSPHRYADRTFLFFIIHDITEKTLLENKNQTMAIIIILIMISSVGVFVIFSMILKRNSKKLMKSNAVLQEKEESLKLILDSAAEAIYGMDLNGICTFCNESCLRMLRYDTPEDLIGKNMHWLIHHSYLDGTRMPIEKCEIFKAFMSGKEAHVDTEVLWRSDGTYFDAEFFSYPQFRDGKLVGAVVTFLDITDRKKAEQAVAFLSYHDALTGLYNRRYLEEEIKRLDVERNLPISIIMGDLDGLKIMNDIFGHSAGDELLKKTAEVMRKNCRSDDIIARWGGDEFLILLPKTEAYDAERIAGRIEDQLSRKKVESLNCSISLGYDTKQSKEVDISRTIENAENHMYTKKTIGNKIFNKTAIDTIIKTLHNKYPEEEKHSVNVSNLCRDIGIAANLTKAEIKRVQEAGYLHDIGKIVLDKAVLGKREALTEKEISQVRQHPEIGYRILNSSDDTLILAKYVLSHHENWDGSGYPKGLKALEIPRLARIISLAECYDTMVSGLGYKEAMSHEEAVSEIVGNAGTQFDPEIVDVFLEVVAGKK